MYDQWVHLPMSICTQGLGAKGALTSLDKKMFWGTLTEIKICGIWYCSEQERGDKLNITDKIAKLENNLRLWRSKNVTFEGKSLILKAFGISQLV